MDESSASVTMLPANRSHVGNDSIDVVLRGCFGCFDTLACARWVTNVIFISLGFVVASLCSLHGLLSGAAIPNLTLPDSLWPDIELTLNLKITVEIRIFRIDDTY